MNGESVLVIFIAFIVLILAFAAWLLAIAKLVEAARMKGHGQDGTGSLWFIGIFASPIVLGLYTASLPDRSASAAPTPGAPIPTTPTSPRDELPAI